MAGLVYISILLGPPAIHGYPIGLLEGFVVAFLLRCLKRIPAIEVALGMREYAQNRHARRILNTNA